MIPKINPAINCITKNPRIVKYHGAGDNQIGDQKSLQRTNFETTIRTINFEYVSFCVPINPNRCIAQLADSPLLQTINVIIHKNKHKLLVFVQKHVFFMV
jgi:hypothetical protein